MAQGPFINRAPDYTDIDLNFLADRTTKDVQKLVGEDAIKRSVRNLVFTGFSERPFRSWLGSGVRQMLFENMTPMTAIFLKNAIAEVINNYEPRVRLIEVTVDEDIDHNGFNVRLQYVILNRELPIIQDLFLEKIR